MKQQDSQTIAVIDFETTGLSPNGGGRATEIAAVLVRDGVIVDSYQSLMKTGAWVPPFIQELTGISNEMLAQAPNAASVMQDLAVFTRSCPLVAHNAAFDRGFWQAEMANAGCAPDPAHEGFACTVLLSRRLYLDAPNCRLGTLAQFHGLPDSGRAHRALADAMTTAHLLLRIQADVNGRFANELAGLRVEHGLLTQLQKAPKAALKRCVQDFAKRRALQTA